MKKIYILFGRIFGRSPAGIEPIQSVKIEKIYRIRDDILKNNFGKYYHRKPEEKNNDWLYVKRIFPLLCMEGNLNGALSVFFGKSISEIQEPYSWMAKNFMQNFDIAKKKSQKQIVIETFISCFKNDPAEIFLENN